MIRERYSAGRPAHGPMRFADEDEVHTMIRGFELDECRVIETAAVEWTCKGCGEVNPIELGAPEVESCSGCGALRPKPGRRRVWG